jgi:membrane protein YqaA with SNARE-associated domain
MFKRINDWYLKWVETKYSTLILFISAFSDASFFTLPAFTFFTALSLTKTSRSYVFATVATLGTITGAFAGYLIGHYAWINHHDEFTLFARFMFDHIPGFSMEVYEDIKALYVEWDLWIIIAAIFTPIPYKYFAFTAGIFDLNMVAFLITAFLSQAVRFAFWAFIIRRNGDRIKSTFVKNLKPIAITISICIIVAILFIKLF